MKFPGRCLLLSAADSLVIREINLCWPSFRSKSCSEALHRIVLSDRRTGSSLTSDCKGGTES